MSRSNGRHSSSPQSAIHALNHSLISPPTQSTNQSINRLSNPHFHTQGLSKFEAEQSWLLLSTAIDEIRSGNASMLRFEELYRTSYMLVLHKYGEFLYLKVQDKLINQLLVVRANIEKVSNDRLIDCLIGEYNHHTVILHLIKDILMYLDKRFCAKQKIVPVFDLGQLLFRDQIIRNPSINHRLKSQILESINRERNGELIDRASLKSILGILVSVNVHSLEVYQIDFETDFISQSQSFYASESQSFYQSNSCADYCIKVEQRIREEESRCDAYLHSSTRPKLRNVVYSELIGRFARSLIRDDSGAEMMMQRGLIEDLHRLYVLFAMYQQHVQQSISPPAIIGSRRSSLDSSNQSINQSINQSPLDMLRECMCQLVKSKGVALLCEKDHRAEPHVFVSACLSIRQSFNHFVEQCFCSDRSFIRSLKDSLESFMNSDARTSHYLSAYLDEFMRKDSKALSATEIESKLVDLMSLFRLLHDKDVFEEFYKQSLSQRLLSSTSANFDIERSLIAKLKAECGHQYTSRLEGMFKDMDLSKSINQSYHDSTQLSGTRMQCELNVSILTTGFWPLPINQSINTDIQFPLSAQSILSHFSSYYCALHSGRRIAWLPSFGSCELRVDFPCGRRELVVHTLQMICLMLYNERATYSFEEISTLTRIPSSDLTRQLLSLAHPTVRILKKSPNTRAVESHHTFTINTDYSSPYYRIKIPLLGKVADQHDSSTITTDTSIVPAAVMEARKNGVEAAIVRIMKARKTCDHSSVCAEVSKQLSQRFTVDATFMKKRIESLIEREYLARDEKDRRVYHYLA